MRVHRAIFFLNDEEQLTSDVLWPHAEQRNRKCVAASRAQANKARNPSLSPQYRYHPPHERPPARCLGGTELGPMGDVIELVSQYQSSQCVPPFV